MKELYIEIKRLQKSLLKKKIERRLKEFESFRNKKSNEWFSELCFCILTANSKAKTAINIQNELGAKGFTDASQTKIRDIIIRNKHRFHNNKSIFIVEARKHFDIKKKVTSIVKKEDEVHAREWIVKNIKGIGYKEASHFLRNVGYKNVAILDRHIINLMFENKLIKIKPKTLTGKLYSEFEKRLSRICDEMKMSQAELDLYMWYIKTGEVLK